MRFLGSTGLRGACNGGRKTHIPNYQGECSTVNCYDAIEINDNYMLFYRAELNLGLKND